MMKMGEQRQRTELMVHGGEEHDEEKWVHDGSVDHKGRVPLRDSTGVWKASLFVIAIEFNERLSYFGIAMSLIIYLTKVIHQDLKIAAKSVNYWTGVTTMMPLFGGFLADSYLGGFSTVLVSSFVYIIGLGLLILSRAIPSIRPCPGNGTCHDVRKIHEVVFFVAIYLVSVGTGGHKPSLESFGADQFDDDHAEERKQKLSFFNWWNSGLCSGLLLGVTLVVYVQDHVSWGVADIILTAVMAGTIVVFCAGRPFYRYRGPRGSPLTPILQVVVAAVAKRNLHCPSDPSRLYEVDSERQKSQQGRLLCHTDKFKFLDKAAILIDDAGDSAEKQQHNPWRLATVTKVEELKLILNMVPIWLASLPFGVAVAQASTFFIKQAVATDRRLTPHFLIPPASVYSLAAIGMIVALTLYDKILVPALRRATGNERGISILQRIGIGMAFAAVAMAVAAAVERKRLNISPGATMSVLWLAPQFVILGVGNAFSIVGLQEYFYDQVPDSMRSLGIAFYLSVIGAANFLSSLLITIIDHATEGAAGGSWFGKDLNSSRLDYFYGLLAAVNAANLVIYVVLAKKYPYKSVQRKAAVVADRYGTDGGRVVEAA